MYVNTHCSGQISLKICMQVSSWPHNILATMTLDDVGQFFSFPNQPKLFMCHPNVPLLQYFKHLYFPFMQPVMLIGNKCDLSDHRAVDKERGQLLADEYDIEFMETSAKDNINIKEVSVTYVCYYLSL